MHSLTYFSLVAANLLVSQAFSLLLLGTIPNTASVMQAQTSQNLPTEVERLNQEAIQLYQKHQFPEALEKFQKVLALVRELRCFLTTGHPSS